MAEKLTPQQQCAVENRGGRLLVSAAAGSGKTKVLVDRLMGYLSDPVNPANLDEFLIITYTKAAASELRGKIAAKLTEKIAENPENRHLQHQMQRLYLTKISTVHAFCADILREYAYRLDIAADFRVADENECLELRTNAMDRILEDVYDHLEEYEDIRTFVDSQGIGRNDALVPKIVLKVYDSAKCHLDPDKWLSKCLDDGVMEGLSDASETVWGKYLIEELDRYLDMQIDAMERCVNMASEEPGYEKPCTILRDIVNQLDALRACEKWDDVVRYRNIDYGRLIFPRKNANSELNESIKAVREACKKGLAKRLRRFTDTTEQISDDLIQVSAAARGLLQLVVRFDRAFSQAKRGRRVLDFSDLEHKTLDLLLGSHRTGPTALAEEIGRRFREVMVDEYQDSNSVQDAIFTAITREKQNCFMVGDVKQSIYQFRLADPTIFLEKYKCYSPAAEAEPGQGRKVLLSSNFRSGKAVISAVNDVFSLCMSPSVGGLTYGEAEALREGIPHNPLPEPETELYCINTKEDTYAEEAAFTAQRISELLDGSHTVRDGENERVIQPQDIVILLRSPGSVGQQFQNALEARGIRCNSGGGNDLLETEEIGFLRCLLQTIDNPRQDIPLIGALASPVFGFTGDDLAEFRASDKTHCVYDALMKSGKPKALAFLEKLEFLRSEARMKNLVPFLEQVFVTTGVERVYSVMPGGSNRVKNLHAFYQTAISCENSGRRDLQQFLAYLDAMEDKGLTVSSDQASSGAVTIMSIHKSKGLEFPVVFLCNLSREFNRESLSEPVLCDRELGLGLCAVDRKNRVRYATLAKSAIAVKAAADSLSEELRVLYVAMTRARDRLIMTYASKSLEKDLQELSQRMDLSGTELLTSDAVCPGEWVLLAALHRTEAGELFALGGKPRETVPGDPAWLIRTVDAPQITGSAGPDDACSFTFPAADLELLRHSLSFRYPYSAATAAPSKVTATQQKGRQKDEEAAENTKKPSAAHREWRKPSFVERKTQGKAYGTALHATMQYISYSDCQTEEAVAAQIRMLVEKQYLSEEAGKMVNCKKIAAFFASEMGRKLCSSENVLREFKFSILDDACRYGEGLEGEKVLLQGVVDCALVEDDGITIVDFKTDYVTEDTISSVSNRYRLQIEAYSNALSRIYERKIKAAYLYFFHLDRLVQL